jgi:hypothetical protein
MCTNAPAFGKRPGEEEGFMIASIRNHRGFIFAAAWAVILAALPAFAAQTAANQDLAKKYANYIGKYEFDLSAMGGGTRVFEFYIKAGAFWIEYGFTSPGELKLLDGTVDQFTFTDPDDGLCKLTFQKDADGHYAKVRMVVASLQMDIVGTKQK